MITSAGELETFSCCSSLRSGETIESSDEDSSDEKRLALQLHGGGGAEGVYGKWLEAIAAEEV